MIMIIILGHCQGPDVQAQWHSGGIMTGNNLGGTSNGNLPFTLCLMKEATGYSDDAQGSNNYINLCKQNGLLPIGCGSVHYNCDKHRYRGEPCVPMPEEWNCPMIAKLRDNTGWGNNIVAMQDDDQIDTHLYSMRGWGLGLSNDPTANDKLKAVCGQVVGSYH